MMMGGVTNAILLVALALGYVVYYLGRREEKELKTVGYVIGTFIICFAIFCLVSNMLISARMCNLMGKQKHMGMFKKVVPPQMPPK